MTIFWIVAGSLAYLAIGVVLARTILSFVWKNVYDPEFWAGTAVILWPLMLVMAVIIVIFMGFAWAARKGIE